MNHNNNQVQTFAQNLINEVHHIWEINQNLYPDGYGIFYSYVYHKPTIMLIGDNPGGDKESFLGKETLMNVDEPMEYLTFRKDNKYKIAGKTCDLFESIGYLDLLRTTVKTNRNFFRSKNWNELSDNHKIYCIGKLKEIIELLSPTVILFESMGAMEKILDPLNSKKEYKETGLCKSNNKTIFWSFVCDNKIPRLIVGYHHLTSAKSHLTNDEISIIGIMLKNELDNLKDN